MRKLRKLIVELMHTKSCFIRKNTPELFNKLKHLGCKISTFNPKKLCDGILFNTYVAFSISESDYDFILSEYKKHNRSIIDCGINEDLFLAIASLRDDSDVGQWFVIDTEAYTDINKGDWFKSTDVNGKYHVGTKIDPLYCHKATVSEIIEHFK